MCIGTGIPDAGVASGALRGFRALQHQVNPHIEPRWKEGSCKMGAAQHSDGYMLCKTVFWGFASHLGGITASAVMGRSSLVQPRASAIAVVRRRACSVKKEGSSAVDLLPLRLCVVSIGGCETLDNGNVFGVHIGGAPLPVELECLQVFWS